MRTVVVQTHCAPLTGFHSVGKAATRRSFSPKQRCKSTPLRMGSRPDVKAAASAADALEGAKLPSSGGQGSQRASVVRQDQLASSLVLKPDCVCSPKGLRRGQAKCCGQA